MNNLSLVWFNLFVKRLSSAHLLTSSNKNSCSIKNLGQTRLKSFKRISCSSRLSKGRLCSFTALIRFWTVLRWLDPQLILGVMYSAQWIIFFKNPKFMSNNYWECLLYREAIWYFAGTSSTSKYISFVGSLVIQYLQVSF